MANTPPSRRRAPAAQPKAQADSPYASADDLVVGDLGDGEDLTLPSGKKVRLRGLSRHELHFSGKGTEDNALIERRNIVSCLVQPRMTMAQVEQWQRSSTAGGDLKALSEAILERSSLKQGADKSDLRTDGPGT